MATGQVAHLDHGLDEGVIELLLRARKLGDQGLGLWGREQGLIRSEDALALREHLEVDVVEDGGGRVHCRSRVLHRVVQRAHVA